MKKRQKFSTLILDCDGVIVDSEPLSCKAWNIVFEREYGILIGTDYEEILGTNTKYAAEFYLKKNNLEISEEIIKKLSILKEAAYIELAKNLKPINGIENVIREAKSLDMKIAVASSGIESKIRFSLKQVNLEHVFDALVGSTPELRGKPFPDIFLRAAKVLDVNPKCCIVIEDTPNGVAAAKEAGMFIIGITTTFQRNKISQADKVISSYSELDLESIVLRTFG